MVDGLFLICNLSMGCFVAAIAYTNRSNYAHLIDAIERDLSGRLRQLRVPTAHLRRRINLWVVIVAATFFGLGIGLNSFAFAILAGVLMGAGPWHLVRRMSQRRQMKIEDQLADAMVSFSSGIKAGLSLPQSLQLLADECPKPIRQEFQQMVGEYKLGKPLERSLEEAKERLKSENFILFSAALMASRESGGRLNETVERIAKSVLELQRLERKVKSETAQARKSAIYMAIVPVVLLIVYAVIDPQNTELLFVTMPGQIILCAAVVLNVAAYFWALKILNADI